MPGTCDPRFIAVQEEFERNFSERGEVGASVCVVLDGQVVVDLWGGVADPGSGRSWERDTVNVVASCSKGVTAICANLLIDRGELDPDAPVAHYWPEFAAEGKAEIAVRQVLNHSSGLFNFGEAVPDCADWEHCVGALERTAPSWEPGTKVGYHAITIGYLAGELVRRVTGLTVGQFLREEIAGPRELDLWIGIPPEVEERVATSVPYDMTQLPPEALAKLMDPESPTAQVLGNTGGWYGNWDDPRLHAAELPAVGAITNARGLAGLYAPLSVGGDGLVSEEGVARMGRVQSATDLDHVLRYRSTYTMGLSKSWVEPQPDGTLGGVHLGEDAFGTPGFGGQIGFADPGRRLAFAYTMNAHGAGTGLNARGQSLIDATYETVGSPGKLDGVWRR